MNAQPQVVALVCVVAGAETRVGTCKQRCVPAAVNSEVSQLLAQGGRGWTQGAGVLTNTIGIHERCGGLCTMSEHGLWEPHDGQSSSH